MTIALADIPIDLPAFFVWFREQTEATWATYETFDFSTVSYGDPANVDWQRGTRWLGGLTEVEIDAVERRWSIRFPPDYRLFLRMLHTVDRPQIGKLYHTSEIGIEEMVMAEAISFANWLADDDYIEQYLNKWIREGFEFDIEHHSNFWPTSWGTKPEGTAAQQARMTEMLAQAPKMIPIHHHRFLLAEPCVAGNPIYSIWQSDIIIYGDTLRDWLLYEFVDLLPVERKEIEDYWWQQRRAREPFYMQVPFWNEIATL